MTEVSPNTEGKGHYPTLTPLFRYDPTHNKLVPGLGVGKPRIMEKAEDAGLHTDLQAVLRSGGA